MLVILQKMSEESIKVVINKHAEEIINISDESDNSLNKNAMLRANIWEIVSNDSITESSRKNQEQ